MTYDPPTRLRRLPSWLVGQLARTGDRLVGEALASERLRRQHFALLSSLAEQGSASQAMLGRRLWIDRRDLHDIVAELEARGLVERTRDPGDRRRNVVLLTDAGRDALARLERAVAAAQSELLAPLAPDERRVLKRLLERLVAAHTERVDD